jgi:RNA polymerase sigma-70 factor (ECF subfamily)
MDAPLAAATPPSLEREAPEFERVFREFAPYVLRVLPRLGVAQRDLDDVAQEVFWAVHRGLPGFEGRSTVKTWLYGICIRICANYRARAHRRHEQLVAQPDEVLDTHTAVHALESRRALAALDAVLAALPDLQRAVFVLHEVEALAVSEIAQVFECSKFTIYARLYAARRTVQNRMAEYGQDYGSHD